jgi:methylated-DNA-protein-cysteine methyltransferase-like protein
MQSRGRCKDGPDAPHGRQGKLCTVDEQAVERVREVVAAIPPGRVLAYGDVAARAGLKSARLVGRIMAEDSADLPWHRVLRADGTIAPHIAREQLARLRAEGILAVDGRVPMSRYRAT